MTAVSTLGILVHHTCLRKLVAISGLKIVSIKASLVTLLPPTSPSGHTLKQSMPLLWERGASVCAGALRLPALVRLAQWSNTLCVCESIYKQQQLCCAHAATHAQTTTLAVHVAGQSGLQVLFWGSIVYSCV